MEIHFLSTKFFLVKCFPANSCNDLDAKYLSEYFFCFNILSN